MKELQEIAVDKGEEKYGNEPTMEYDSAGLIMLYADGNPVTAETLKNACEIVRTTTKQKMIEKFKQWLLDNIQITAPEENRGMLADLLKRMEE